MKHYLAMIVAYLLLMASVIENISYSAPTPNNIYVTGEIRLATCYFDGIDGQLHGAYTWTLPTVSVSTLGSKGATAALQQSHIMLAGAYCSSGVTPKINFDTSANGAAIDMANGYLLNNIDVTSGGAQNVEIQLLDDKLDPLDLRNSPNLTCPTIDESKQSICVVRYQYYATAMAQAGKVSSTLIFTVSYD